MPKVSKICEICGEEYFVGSSQANKRRTCGKKECKSRWRLKNCTRIKKICEICGGEYFVYPSEINKYYTCCKKECKSEYRSKMMSGKNNSNYKGKITKICEVCGDEYCVIPSIADKRHTCSKKCRYRLLTGERNSRWSRVKKICEVCGDEYCVTLSMVNKRYTCGKKECKSKWQSENYSGEKHPMWNGGKVKKICEICGDEYFDFPSNIDKRCTCGKSECISKWQSENRSGEKNYRWNGGKIKKICEICGDEYLAQINSIDKRHTCGKKECMAKHLSMVRQGVINPEDWQGFAKEKQYCEKWTPELRRRIRLYFGNKSVLSGKDIKETGRRLSCHHVYHEKEACCDEWDNDIKGYFTMVNEERYYIDGNPDKFVSLTTGENAIVERDKLYYIQYFEKLINEKYNGISYYTKEEYKWIMQEPSMNEHSQINGTYFPLDFDHGR